MVTEHRVLFADSRDLGFIPSESIDLVVTSPPYPMIEMWDGLFSAMNPRIGEALAAQDGRGAFEAMHRELDGVWAQVYRVLKAGAIACLNIGDATRTIGGSFQLFTNHARVLQACAGLGLQALPDIVWRKPTNAPNKFVGSGMYPPSAYVTFEHEWILLLRKGGLRRFIGRDEQENRRESCFFWEERNVWFSDVWELTGARQETGNLKMRPRSGAFPLELAYRLINMFSVKKDRVLDPFLGSGTTLLAAMACGRHCTGIEVDPQFRGPIREGVSGIVAEANRRISARIERHLGFVRERESQGKMPAYRNRHYGFPVVTRQEREILFHGLTAVRSVGEDAWEVEYEDQPEVATTSRS